MASVLISALIVVALSAAIGRAICVFSGWHPSCLAPAVGFAALLVLGGAVQFVPGDALTVALLTAALAVAALFVRVRPAPRSALVEGAAVVGIVLLFVVVMMHPEWCLLALATLFWLSGPLAYLWSLVFRRRSGPPPVVAASEAP